MCVLLVIYWFFFRLSEKKVIGHHHFVTLDKPKKSSLPLKILKNYKLSSGLWEFLSMALEMSSQTFFPRIKHSIFTQVLVILMSLVYLDIFTFTFNNE